MASSSDLTQEEQDFLSKCEEEFKDRFTEKDEEFMKVFSAEQSTPPIIESWWVPQNAGHRNDRRNKRRYDRHDRSDRGHHDRHDNYERRGYNDQNNRSEGFYNKRPRY